MSDELDLWRLLAGLGLFLFGMHTLELALKQLAGRPFKRFLQQYTAKPAQGIVIGALSSAALQSSSVASLIVLAFVGAAILRHILRRDEVTSELVLGGTCVYLFMGILFVSVGLAWGIRRRLSRFRCGR